MDRIEVASGRTSDGERSAVGRITDWAETLGLAGPRRGAGVRRRAGVGRLDAVRGRPRDQPADQGLAQALPGTAPARAGGARRRHPPDGRLRRAARHRVQRLPGGLVERHARLARLRAEPRGGARRHAGAAADAVRHARHPESGGGAGVRRADDAGISVLPLRLPRPQRLRAGDGQHAGGGAGRRARRPLHGERHGGTGRQHPARRGRRVAARPRRPADERQRAGAGRRQPARRELLGPPGRAQQADRRRERVHPGGRRARRRRPQGPALREPPAAVAVRPAALVRHGQADGQGEPGVQPGAAQRHADGRGEAATARAHRRARRPEAARHHGRPAVPDHRAAADPRAAGVRGEGLLHRQQPGPAAGGDHPGALPRRGAAGHGLGRRRLRRVHAGAQERGGAARHQGAAAARLPGADSAGRQDRRARRDDHQVGQRPEDRGRRHGPGDCRHPGDRARAERHRAAQRARRPAQRGGRRRAAAAPQRSTSLASAD